jgi:hypothetical protein
MAACQRVRGLVGALRFQACSFYDLRNTPICLASPDAEPACAFQVMVRYYEDFYGDFYSDWGCVPVVTINTTAFESDPSTGSGGVSVDLPDPEDQQPMDQCFDAMQTA